MKIVWEILITNYGAVFFFTFLILILTDQIRFSSCQIFVTLILYEILRCSSKVIGFLIQGQKLV